MTARNVRNNNPANIEYVRGVVWVGQCATQNDLPYLQFETPEDGFRAAAKDLKHKYAAGLTTIRKIISKWAPPSENNTTAYIDAVKRSMLKDPDTDLKFPDDLLPLIRAMAFEEGGCPWTDGQIQLGIDRS